MSEDDEGLPPPETAEPSSPHVWGTSAPPTETPKRGVPWRGREAIVIFLLHLAGTVILTLPFLLANSSEETIFSVATLITEMLLLIVTITWVRIRYREGPRSLGLRGLSPANVGIGVGIAAGGLLVASIISGLIYTIVESFTGEPVGDPQQIPIDEPTTAQLWIIGVSVVILAPVAEEVFFRGFLYPALRRWARPWPAVLLSAGFFGLAHIDWRVVPPIFALGVVLAWVVEKRRSLVPAIVGHLFFNLFGFVLLFLLD